MNDTERKQSVTWNRKKTSILLGCFLAVCGVVVSVSIGYHRLASAFSQESVAKLTATIDQKLTAPEIHTITPLSKVKTIIHQDGVTWTKREYTVPLETGEELSNILYELSEAIQAGEGEIFQTFFHANKQKATLVFGIESYITHIVTLTWPAPPARISTAAASQENARFVNEFRAAIIIDDIGGNTQIVDRFLHLGLDLTFSILPHLKYSTRLATMLHERRKETLLHLPMEPQGYPETSPGEGAILVSTSQDRIDDIITRDLQTVPFVSGVNNHMGSRLTQQPETMRTILETLHQQQLFFLDSRTTAQSVAYQVAQQIGIKSAERKVFLDVVPQLHFVKSQLNELALLAEQGKPAIAIGHPKDVTLQALQEMLPEFQQRHITIVRVSEFMR